MIDQNHFTATANLAAIDIAKDWNVALVQDIAGRPIQVRESWCRSPLLRSVSSLPQWSRPNWAGADRRLPSSDRPPAAEGGFQVVSIS